MPLTPHATLQQRYRIIRTIGSGGMGTVFLAEDTRLRGRLCAVKEHRPDPGLNAVDLAKLRRQFEEREAGILAALDHPNLPKVFDYFTEGGNDYLVMDFVAGENLHAVLNRHIKAQGQPLPENVILTWAQQVIDALHYLHMRPTGAIIHRDVKPANIILTDEGRIKLVDFGLAKLVVPTSATVSESMRLGTLDYAPPEQFAAALGHTDERSDVFSLGATLYHLLTGEPPPAALERAAGVAVLVPARERNAAISAATSDVLTRACALRKEERFASTASMGQALGLGIKSERRITDLQSPDRPNGQVQGPSGSSRNGHVALAMVGLAGLMFVILILLLLDPTSAAPPETPTVASQPAVQPVEVTREVEVEGPVVEVTREVTAPAFDPPAVGLPSGHIAFHSDVDGDDEIFIMDASGGDRRQVTDHPAADNFPSLSPDGQRIAFVSNRDGNDEIYIVRTDGGGLQRLTHHDAEDRLPAWSPDGGRIAFNSTRGGVRALYVMNADGSDIALIRNAHTSSGHPSWSPQGDNLVYNAGDYSDTTWEIERLALGNGMAKTLTNNDVTDWAPHWSPNGEVILFFSKQFGSADLWVMSSDAGDARAVFSGPGYEWGGSWSPDSSYIAFTTEIGGRSNIYRIRADGSDLVQLTDSGGAYASWSR